MILARAACLLLTCQAVLAGEFQPKIEVGGMIIAEPDNPATRRSSKPEIRRKISLVAGKKTVLRWAMTYHGTQTREDVLVHFYVVKEDQPGQPAVREIKPGSVQLESALTMDFHDGDDTRAELSLLLQDPGVYMVRLEAFLDGQTMVTATLDVEAGR